MRYEIKIWQNFIYVSMICQQKMFKCQKKLCPLVLVVATENTQPSWENKKRKLIHVVVVATEKILPTWIKKKQNWYMLY